MTIPGSTVVTAATYIFNSLAAMSNVITELGQPVAVTSTFPIYLYWDEPANRDPEDQISVASDIEQTAEHHAYVGSGAAHAMLEEYKIRVACSSYRGTRDASVTMAAALVLVNMVDTAVRTDPSLGGAVLSAWPTQHRWATGFAASNKGLITEVEIEISVSAET